MITFLLRSKNAVCGSEEEKTEEVYNTEDHFEIVQWDMMKSLICENMSMKYIKKEYCITQFFRLLCMSGCGFKIKGYIEDDCQGLTSISWAINDAIT